MVNDTLNAPEGKHHFSKQSALVYLTSKILKLVMTYFLYCTNALCVLSWSGICMEKMQLFKSWLKSLSQKVLYLSIMFHNFHLFLRIFRWNAYTHKYKKLYTYLQYWQVHTVCHNRDVMSSISKVSSISFLVLIAWLTIP